MAAFNEMEIIVQKQKTIDELVTWIYNHTASKEEYVQALRDCYISEEDIEGYTEDYEVPEYAAKVEDEILEALGTWFIEAMRKGLKESR